MSGWGLVKLSFLSYIYAINMILEFPVFKLMLPLNLVNANFQYFETYVESQAVNLTSPHFENGCDVTA